MAIKITLESFLAVLRRSGLIEADLIQRLVDEFRAAHGEPPEAKPFADLLVERKLITPWQADKLLVGKHKGFFLGKYKLKGLLGKGGMSSVYLAEHVLMRRMCAIKVLPARRVNDASYLGRFHREAQAVAALDHPNIVRAYDVDHEKDGEFDIHFLVMEYVEGKSLLDMVAERGPLGPVEAAQYIRQAALGLHHAHGAGIIHRDMKPGNLLVDTSGTVKLLDMGLARFFGGDDEKSLTIQHDEKVLGTADYLAPEQAVDSHKVDRRVDLYSLGCTLYFLFTAQPPFNEGTLTQRLMAHQLRDPKPITEFRADVPDSLLAIMRKMMAKKPEDRYATAKEVADALSDWLLRQGAALPEATSDSGPLNLTAPAVAPAPAVSAPAAAASPPAPVESGVPDFFGIGASAAEPVQDAPGDFANLFGGGPAPAPAPAAAKAPVRTAAPKPAASPTPLPKPASGTKPGKKGSAAEVEVPAFFGGAAGNNGGGDAPAEVGHFTDLFTGEAPKTGSGIRRVAPTAPAPVAKQETAEPGVPDFLRAAAPAPARTAPAKTAPGKNAAAKSSAPASAPKPVAKGPSAPAAKAPAATPPRAADEAPPFLAGAAPAPAADNPFGTDLFGFHSASNETAAPAAPAPPAPAPAPAPKPAAKPAAAVAPPAPKPAATPPAPVAEGVPDFLSGMTAEPASESPAGDDPFGFHAAPAAPAAKAPAPPKPAPKPPATTAPKAAPAATAPAKGAPVKAAPASPSPTRPAPAAEEVPAFLNASAAAPADEAPPMGDLFGFGAAPEPKGAPPAPTPPAPKPAPQSPAKPAASQAPAAPPPPAPAQAAPPKPAAKSAPAAAPADEMPAFLGGAAASPAGESENPFGAEMFGIGAPAAEPPPPAAPAPAAPPRQAPPAKAAAASPPSPVAAAEPSPPPFLVDAGAADDVGGLPDLFGASEPAAAPAPSPKAKPAPKAAPAPAKAAVEVPDFLQAGGAFSDSPPAAAPAASEDSPFTAAAPAPAESPADDSPFGGSAGEERVATPVRRAKKGGPSPLAGVQAWLQVPKNRLIAGGAAVALLLVIGAVAFMPGGKPQTTASGTVPAAAPAPGTGGTTVAASSVRQATVRPRPQGETITVGPEGNFGTVTEAVSYFMRNIPADGSRRTIRVAGGYSYSESVTIAAAIGISSPLTITTDAAQPAVLTPRGGGVILNIPFATDLILENLVFDAGGAPNCAQLEVLGTGSQLKNVEFRGFRENGLVIASVPGDQAQPVLIDGCRFKGFDPGAKGLVFKTSADNLFGLTVTNSQFSAPMRTGIEVGSASISSFQVTQCRFVDVRTGVLFPAPKQEFEEVQILNNTFYKAADAIVFNHVPEAKRPMKSAVIGNLFAGSTTTDVSIRSGFTKQQWDQFLAGGPGVAGNMSQREGELGANEVDVFGQGGKRPLKELSFVSTTPGTPEFLKPTGANVSFTKPKAGNAWAGAVQP